MIQNVTFILNILSVTLDTTWHLMLFDVPLECMQVGACVHCN